MEEIKMAEIDGMEIPVKVVKEEDEINVIYGQFPINQNIGVSVNGYLEAEEILDLENEMKSREGEFLTKIWVDVPTYINLTTALFELYGEEIDKSQVVPDDEDILKLRDEKLTDDEFIDGLYKLFGVI